MIRRLNEGSAPHIIKDMGPRHYNYINVCPAGLFPFTANGLQGGVLYGYALMVLLRVCLVNVTTLHLSPLKTLGLPIVTRCLQLLFSVLCSVSSPFIFFSFPFWQLLLQICACCFVVLICLLYNGCRIVAMSSCVMCVKLCR